MSFNFMIITNNARIVKINRSFFDCFGQFCLSDTTFIKIQLLFTKVLHHSATHGIIENVHHGSKSVAVQNAIGSKTKQKG